jgi:hypothetical protein
MPGVFIALGHVRFGARIGEANDPLLATTWRLTVSWFLQMTVSPPLTVTVRGTNPVGRMFTVLVATPDANANPEAARTQTAAVTSRTFFIGDSPWS